MRLTKIEFNGFKRLFKASCNVDGKLIALVGPNEAGKSSVLEGLTWLTAGQQLPNYARTRNEEISDDTPAVRATFILAQDDLDALGNLPLDAPPTTFTLVRTVGGERRTGAYPRVIVEQTIYTRAMAIATDTRRFLLKLAKQTRENTRTTVATVKEINSITERLGQSISNKDEELSNLLTILNDTLTELQNAHSTTEVLKFASQALQEVQEVRAKIDRDLDGEVRRILELRAPEFVLFSESDRTLRTSYDLADEQLRAAAPRAIVNLLQVAETNIETVFSAIQSGDTTHLKSLIRRINLKLGRSLLDTWHQSQLSLEVDTDGTQLQILINENNGDGTTTAIQERSDGLRTFVSLLSFLTVRHTERKTILLIDEAETHLHIDAQADLIGMLTRQELVDQVIYTTHSPACLPTDLGSGVRLVEPCQENPGTSKLLSSFWQKNLPGFNPLLLAMGAGAAAFSVCRQAVLCEGPSEMILLPRLLRMAMDVSEVSFQVAPGLSLVSKKEIDFRDLASKVVYLVDGDEGGQDLKTMLKKSGVPEDKIVSLSNGYALEDLVERSAYLNAIVTLLRESGHHGIEPDDSSLSGKEPVSKNLESWAKANQVKLPSKVAVASMLAREMEKATISTEGETELKRTYTRIMNALEAPN